MNIKFKILISILLLSAFISNSAEAGLFSIGASESTYMAQSFVSSENPYLLTTDFKNSIEEKLDSFNISSAFVAESATHVTPQVKRSGTRKYVVSISAYSSTPDQTDSSPFITAKGTYVRDGIVATNFLPFGTAIKIPQVYGDKIFIVEDRMNSRYTTNVDIWMADRSSALKFGRKSLTIEVL